MLHGLCFVEEAGARNFERCLVCAAGAAAVVSVANCSSYVFWSTKLCVFPCKMAAAGDERCLVCAAGAAAVVSVANCSSYVFCKEWLFLCA